MEKFFKLKEHGTNVRTEIIAGITTFLSMAYILAVNPTMLAAAGMDQGAVFTATAVSAAFATIIMAVFANYPVALASGMGLNAYFAYTVCPMLTEMGIKDPWKVALAAILVPVIVEIALWLLGVKLCAAAAQLLDVPGVQRILQGVGDVIEIVFALFLSVASVFLISTAVMLSVKA